MQTGSRFRVRRAAGAVQTDCYEARTDARQAAPFRCFGRHFYGPSVLRHRNAAALSIDPDRRCHVLVTECGCAWDRGKPLPFGAARGGQSWATSSTIFCCSPVWHYSSRGLSSRPRACSSDAATLLSDAPRAVTFSLWRKAGCLQ